MENGTAAVDNKNKRHISALDVVVIMLAVLCIAGIGIRIYIGTSSAAAEITGEAGDYEISLLVSDIRTTSEQFFSKGTAFYLQSGELLGNVTEAPSITPARYITEDENGNCVFINAPENGDESMRDITLTLKVHGTMTERGFVTDLGTYLAPNVTAAIKSEFVKADALVISLLPSAKN